MRFTCPLSSMLLLHTAWSQGQTRDTPLELGAEIRPPALVLQVDPDLGSLATKRDFHGCHVALQVVVDEHGAVFKAKVMSSDDKRCEDPMWNAARAYRFNPATRKGVPVAVIMPLEIAVGEF